MTEEQLKAFSTSLELIGKKDPDMYEAIADLINYLSTTYSDKYESADMPNITKTLLVATPLGKGANVFTMMKYMQRYGTSGFTKSENIVDVFKAIHYGLFEIQRRNYLVVKHNNGTHND